MNEIGKLFYRYYIVPNIPNLFARWQHICVCRPTDNFLPQDVRNSQKKHYHHILSSKIFQIYSL